MRIVCTTPSFVNGIEVLRKIDHIHVTMPTDTANNVLTIKTVQISPFRTLMTALKDILLETNITFQADGIRIINMDKSHTVLIGLRGQYRLKAGSKEPEVPTELP